MPVAARYHRIKNRVLKTVDRALAEPVTIWPFNDGSADTTRNKVDVEGVLRVNGGQVSNAAGGYSGSWRSRISAGTAQMHIDRAQYPDLLVKKGDKLKAMSRHGQPLFLVERIDDRGLSRLVVELSES